MSRPARLSRSRGSPYLRGLESVGNLLNWRFCIPLVERSEQRFRLGAEGVRNETRGDMGSGRRDCCGGRHRNLNPIDQGTCRWVRQGTGKPERCPIATSHGERDWEGVFRGRKAATRVSSHSERQCRRAESVLRPWFCPAPGGCRRSDKKSL